MGAVAAAGTLGATATQAHAATIANGQPTTTATSNDTQSQLNKLQQSQAAHEQQVADQNQATMDQAKQAAAAQESQINNQIKANNDKLAQQTIADGTAKINQDAQTATDQENANYRKASDSQAAENIQTLADAQKNVVTPDQKADQVKQAQAANQTAQQQAKQDLDQANTQIQDDYTKAKAPIESQIDQIKNDPTQDPATIKQNATKQIDDQTKVAQTVTDQDATQVQQLSNQVKTAQSAVDQATTANNQAQSAVKVAESQMNEIVQHLTIPDAAGYLTAFMNGYPNGEANTKHLKDSDRAVLKHLYDVNQFAYQSDPSLDYRVDPNNLTKDQVTELSLYAAGLLNQIRSQLGLPLVQVTQGAINMAMNTMTNYKADHWNDNGSAGHDVAAIDKAAAANGLKAFGFNAYEDKGNWLDRSDGIKNYRNGDGVGSAKRYYNNDTQQFEDPVQDTTMDILHEGVYHLLLTMLTGSNITPDDDTSVGAEFLHAAGILGYRDMQQSDPRQNFIAQDFAVDTIDYGNDQFEGIHFTNIQAHDQYLPNSLTRYPTQIDPNSDKYDQTVIPSPTANLDALRTTAAQTAASLKTATDALTSNQTKLTAAQQQQATDQKTLDNLTQNRDQLIQKLIDQQTNPNSQLAQLQSQLENLNKATQKKTDQAQAAYQQKLTDLKNDLQAKVAQIQAHPETLPTSRPSCNRRSTNWITSTPSLCRRLRTTPQPRLRSSRPKLPRPTPLKMRRCGNSLSRLKLI